MTKVIKRYSNRKLYDTESAKYTSVLELVKLPLDTFVVKQHGSGEDVTTDTLLSILTSEKLESEIKVKVMKHCISELEEIFQ